jgi:hypothetical protein
MTCEYSVHRVLKSVTGNVNTRRSVALSAVPRAPDCHATNVVNNFLAAGTAAHLCVVNPVHRASTALSAEARM